MFKSAISVPAIALAFVLTGCGDSTEYTTQTGGNSGGQTGGNHPSTPGPNGATTPGPGADYDYDTSKDGGVGDDAPTSCEPAEDGSIPYGCPNPATPADLDLGVDAGLSEEMDMSEGFTAAVPDGSTEEAVENGTGGTVGGSGNNRSDDGGTEGGGG